MKLWLFSSLSLRKQLMMLIVIIFMPVLAILLFTGYQQYRHTLKDIENSTKRLIRLFAEEQLNIVQQTRQLLNILSHVPAIRNLDLDQCNDILKAIHKDNPQYSTIIAADSEGVIDCCAIPLKQSIHVKDRTWFKRIMESHEFVIDNFLISRSAKKASLPFAYPVFNEEGRLLVAVGAAFNLEYYNKIFEKIPLPEDSVIMAVDGKGKVLYQSFSGEKCLGKDLAQCRGFKVPDKAGGNFTQKDADGVVRIFWYERLSVGQESNEICLLVGVSKQVILANIKRMLQVNINVLIVVALASLAIAWFLGGKMILNPINLLLQRTQLVRKGDLSISDSVAELPGELRTLSLAFDDMVVNLSQREKERDQALNALQKARDELEDRVAKRTRQLEEQKAKLARAKEKADAASHAKSEFLSNMSHELRTPLNAILGYVQILIQGKHLSDSQKNSLEIVHKSGRHLLTLINDILDLSKIEAGKIEILPVDLDLSSFLYGIVGIISARAHEKDLVFTFEKLSDPPSGIKADETRLRQVLLNLLGNAVKFTDRGSVVFSVRLEQKDDGARIHFKVEDTGPGMDPEVLEKIFEPFEQVGATQHRFEGTGLGLSISRKLVRAMGGELYVRSEVGRGSCFWFEIAVPTTKARVIGAAGGNEAVNGYETMLDRPLRVLVADDKPYNRELLVDLLEPLGFDTWSAEDGRQAVNLAADIHPHLIITDVVMPVMSGYQAVEEIRRMPETAQAVIIAMSAGVTEKDRNESLLAGCQAFLPKPVDIYLLLEQIEKFLDIKWKYGIEEDIAKLGDHDAGLKPLVPPPPEDLDALHDLARRGNMRKISEYAARIERMDDKYKSFAEKLKHLAADYEEETIQILIERYMKEEYE